MSEILALEHLANASIDKEFFPYCVIDCFIRPEVLPALLDDFPKINIRGSIPAHKLKYGQYFQKLLDELHSDELRTLIAQKFEIDLSESKTLLTVRGNTDISDGKIHADTPSKLITLLLYLNEDWEEESGNLRLLRDDHHLDNYFAEIKPTAGKLLLFKVTENGWHGHYPFTGKRQTLQLNYVSEQKVVDRELKKHARSYVFKQMGHYIKRLRHETNSTD